MAGDWIKMRSDLFTHPKVVRMASALKADRLRVVGGLMSVWCLFDAHSADGKIEGYDFGTVDELLNWSGFAAAMSAVNWLAQGDESLVLPDFDKHNGQSAKRRAQDADRKREVRKASASDADNMRTREEKRREEDKSNPQPPAGGGSAGAEQTTRARRTARATVPYDEIIEAYRQHLPQLPQPELLSRKRKKAMDKAWTLLPEKHRLPQVFRAIFAECNEDPFLNGTGPYRGEHAGWEPTFDYLIREDVIAKVYEKAMHRRAQRHQVNGHGAQPGLALQ
ncbi:hypothetical protein L2Y94_05610 [Luteibacter aegosomatis]|uniref:hypothetical protein n=1 Tax=Luteibacter aegosomatis TaxID=2911537 RepID=UPI001FFA8D17|nr:hypothetical protein [Luteibacter aegosomatis]UPG86831.1 hypothetical protein L2Y94_05610 [Luteibacter aegosomatis]